MGRKRNAIPSYRLHKPTGQAVVTIHDASTGKPIMVYLGQHGSAESKAEYLRICAEYESRGSIKIDNGMTVAEGILAYYKFAVGYYRRADGKPTKELEGIRSSLKPLRELYGHTLAAEFSPKRLTVVRDEMISKGWSRKTVNQRTGRVRRMFKWLVAEEHIPASVSHGLTAVADLKIGRTPAPDYDQIKPVDVELFEATLPHLSPLPRAICQLMRWTGMRPGEACRIRFCEIDRSGPVWIYTPDHHKTKHLGKQRIIAIGPRGQAVINEYLGDQELLSEEAIFSPARERMLFYRRRRAKRKTKVQPSQASRKKANPKRQPSQQYNPQHLAQRVRLACKKAELPIWHPNQLRHLFATEVRRQFGLDGAQVVLGHSKADVTQVYAERDLKVVNEIAKEVG